MSKKKSDIFDDFFVSSEGGSSVHELLDTYSLFEEKISELPRSLIVNDRDSKLKVFREMHARKDGEALYRRRDDASDVLVCYWLARVKEVASIYSSVNKTSPFEGISKEDLKDIAKMSSNVDLLPILESTLSKKGIILVTEKSIPGLKLDGAVFRLETGQAVVALSLRYNRLDNFWFTLLHELSHLSLHFDQLTSPIIEDLDCEATTIIEMEADRLALNSFIPRNVWRNCPPKYNQSKDVVIQFSTEIGIHPSIVAGRLRNEMNRYDILSDLVNEIDVQEVFF